MKEHNAFSRTNMNSFNIAEKGSREWKLFDPVKYDHVGMFRVTTPIQEQPRFTNVIPIRRYHTRPATA